MERYLEKVANNIRLILQELSRLLFYRLSKGPPHCCCVRPLPSWQTLAYFLSFFISREQPREFDSDSSHRDAHFLSSHTIYCFARHRGRLCSKHKSYYKELSMIQSCLVLHQNSSPTCHSSVWLLMAFWLVA